MIIEEHNHAESYWRTKEAKMVKLPDMQIERLKLAFNVFETADVAVFHNYDFGLQGFQLDEAVKADFMQQLRDYGIIHKRVELTQNALIVRRL